MPRRIPPPTALALRRAPDSCALARFYDRFGPFLTPLAWPNLTFDLPISARFGPVHVEAAEQQ